MEEAIEVDLFGLAVVLTLALKVQVSNKTGGKGGRVVSGERACHTSVRTGIQRPRTRRKAVWLCWSACDSSSEKAETEDPQIELVRRGTYRGKF